MRVACLISALIILIPPLADALFSYSCPSSNGSTSVTEGVKIVNGIMWMDYDASTFPELNGTILVDLQRDKSVFDYCSLSSYTPGNISNLLRLHGITEVNKTNFTVVYNQYKMKCPHAEYSYYDQFVVGWTMPHSLYVQQLGAAAFITVNRFEDSPLPYQLVGRADKGDRTIDGVYMTMPMFVITPSAYDRLAKDMSGANDNGNNCCHLTRLETDYNNIRDLLGYGWFSLIMMLMIAINLFFVFWILRITLRVWKSSTMGTNQKVLQLLTLVPEGVMCAERIVFAISPLGIYSNMPFFVSRFFMSIATAITLFVRFVLFVQWSDILRQVQSGMAMKRRVMILSNGRILSFFIFVFVFLIILQIFGIAAAFFLSLSWLDIAEPLFYMALNIAMSVFIFQMIVVSLRTRDTLENQCKTSVSPDEDAPLGQPPTKPSSKETAASHSNESSAAGSAVSSRKPTVPTVLIITTTNAGDVNVKNKDTMPPPSNKLSRKSTKNITRRPTTAATSTANSSAIKETMLRVKRKVSRTTKRMLVSCFLTVVEIMCEAITGTDVFTSGAVAFGCILIMWEVVFTTLSLMSIQILSDLSTP